MNSAYQPDGSRTPSIQAKQRIFFVCYHLPVVVVQSKKDGIWRASWNESLLSKTEGSAVVSEYDASWVGTVTTRPPLSSDKDKQAVRELLENMNCYPIFLDSEIADNHYLGFCKQVLWPAFHNIDIFDLNIQEQHSWDQSSLDSWWGAYQQVNIAFCNAMLEVLQPNDILWVHDYHLCLLPKLMTSGEVNLFGRSVSKRVFFLHIPFPTSQIFRELECGGSLLEGILHADVVGFHAFDHARHFLNASKRIFGLKYETLVGGLIGVHFSGRTVMVTMSNVSIEPHMVDAALMLPSVESGMKFLRDKHKGRFTIGGCDIGQRLQGVSLKLLAFERLLKDYPSWQNQVVMIQRIVLPCSRKDDEAQTSRELKILVKRIKDTFGDAVMDYEEIVGSSIPIDQRLALWRASDVLMVTPIREGLNLWPMEYIYAHKAPETPGVVIASEFSAVASILNGALRVNPYDISMVITTIDKALTMDLQEREGRRYRDIDFVSTSPSDKWTKNVLRDLRDAIQMKASESQNTSSTNTPNNSRHGPQNAIIDCTAAYLARESNLSFKKLSHHAVKSAYERTTNRVLILDFNGTIVIKEPPGKYLKREILGTSGNKPMPEVIEALCKLCADPKNTVYVVSGDSAENVLNAIGNIPGLGLAVSNGAHFSNPVIPGQKRQWHVFDLGVDWDAVKRVALPVLSKYTARSNGSFVKLTHFSIGWSYYSCDPEWGSLQASHLVMELENELQAFDVRFVTLKGVVEIVPLKLNKGLFVTKVLRDVSQQSKEGVDFILCMGDDISDEKMFTSVYSYVAEIGEEDTTQLNPPIVGEDPNARASQRVTEVRDPMYTYTVAVGKKPSHASHWVADGIEVGNLLVYLSGGKSSIRKSGSESKERMNLLS
jgi:trehalose 6-phosphate synthase/phosphatase